MKKQILSTFLTMLMSLSAFSHSIAVKNADGVTIYYNYSADGKELSVTYRGSSYNEYLDEYIGKVVIPESVNYNGKTYPVTSIGSNAFSGCTGLTSIEIPNSVTRILDAAFFNCIGLTSIEIPNSVTSIGGYTFCNCSNMNSIVIPNSVIKVGNLAFENTKWLDNQADGLIYIGRVAYKYKGVTSANTVLKIKDGTETIHESAFQKCTGIISIDIPESVTSIESWAFEGCASLSFIKIPSKIRRIERETFSGCTGLTAIVIPENIISIDDNAFAGCLSLTSIVLPNSLESMGKNVFYNCKKLKTAKIGNGLNTIREGMFLNCIELESIQFGKNIECLESAAFASCTSISSIEIPNSVTKISIKTFDNCTSLKTLTIGANVSSISIGAFNGCVGLQNIIVNNDNTVYDSRDNCNAIIETASNNLFLGCANTIIPNSVTSIGTSAFEGCSGLTTIEIPNSVTRIDAQAFYRCDNLTSIKIPKGVTSLGTSMLYGCTSLMSIELPENLTNLGYGTFGNCESLVSIRIPRLVKYIEPYTFTNCRKLNDVKMEYGVSSIGQQAFQGCSSLKTITIPGSVTSLGYAAFSGVSFQDVYCYPKIIQETNDLRTAFGSNIKYATLHVPCSAIDYYTNTIPWSNFGTIVTLPSYKLVYYVGEQEYKVVEVEEGSPIIQEDGPIKEGYTYVWNNLPEVMPAHDVIVTGSFSINKYKLKYIIDDLEYKSIEIEFDTHITPEQNPSKEGYTFSGWSEIPEVMPAHDVTVTGSFTINKYKVTYMVDGVEYKTVEVEYETSITPETAPIKEGYTFSGWSEIPNTMPAHDVTVTGTFTINKYKVTYMVDGTEYKTTEMEYGKVISPEPSPTKEGYTFSGWSEIPNTVPAHDVTITGTFSINKYKLTYIVDDVEYKAIDVEYGTTLSPIDEPTMTGYTFTGWVGLPETMPAHDVTVVGSFSKGAYILTYMIDGVVYKTVSYDFEASITPETPTKEGYTFSGWTNLPEAMPAHDVIVTGIFTINTYKVTYMVDGVEYKTVEVEYGSTITPEAALSKEGYTFSGWTDLPETMPAHDVAVNATFIANQYNVRYMVNGMPYGTSKAEYGAEINPIEGPSKEGYTFSGWTDLPETMPAHDIYVNGSFTINTYIVKYILDGEEYKTEELEYGSSIVAEIPTKEGYSFSGWTDLPETMPAHDVTVTGSFIINKYKVIYMLDGVEYGTSEVVYGAEVNPIGEPRKEGYTFSGWLDLPEEMPAHDVTVTGTFTVNKYKVTFMYGDNVLTTIEVNYGEAIELPESLNSERYTLIEWKDVPESMPAHDVVIYADYVDGINTITADSKNEQYIRINGMYTNDMKRGVNIIRTQDGKTRKVWVK